MRSLSPFSGGSTTNQNNLVSQSVLQTHKFITEIYFILFKKRVELNKSCINN